MTAPAACPLCGDPRTRPHLAASTEHPESAGEDFGSSRSKAARVSLRRCQGCGAAWRDPMPSAEALRVAYQRMRDERYLEETPGRQRALAGCLRRLDRLAGARRGLLLDVGCSAGIFLALAQADGWDILGVEPSEWLVRQARHRVGERILNTTFEEAQLLPASCAAVTMWDVLEHVAEPREFLNKAAGLLEPNGILAINVPNIASRVARVLGRRWPLLLPEHLYYYSPHSLRKLLCGAGLTVAGMYRHPVYFSAGYIAHRLAQHGLPGAHLTSRLLERMHLQGPTLPILMGELTVLARRSA